MNRKPLKRREYLDISLDLQMKASASWEQRMRFWDSLYLD
jgi:hypothetical protein